MIMDEDNISYRLFRTDYYCYNGENHFEIIPAKTNDKTVYGSLYLLIAFSKTKVMGKWIFNALQKGPPIGTELYSYIKISIINDLKNNLYNETEKQLLKLFLKRNCKIEEEKKEIEELFKSNEEIVQTDIIKPVNHINAGLIAYNDIESMVSGEIEKYKDIINETYSSMIPNGAPGETISHRYLSMQEKYILPIETAGDFLVTDFLNKLYKYRVTHKNNKYLLFILYDIMPPREPWTYIRYIAPIKIEKGSELTVNEAVENYYHTVSASLSNETKRRFEAYLRNYCSNNVSHLQKQK